MTNIFYQKTYINGREYLYNCAIDDEDLVHFINGISNGFSSDPNVPIIDNIIGEVIIKFPTLREIVKLLDENVVYSDDEFRYEITNIEDKIRIMTYNSDILINDLTISKKFLKNSYEILETMWEDD